MKTLIVLSLLLAFANANRICDGTCVQGEGDCDRDSDCLPGLKCEFDWWWGTDVCHAGKILRYISVIAKHLKQGLFELYLLATGRLLWFDTRFH